MSEITLLNNSLHRVEQARQGLFKLLLDMIVNCGTIGQVGSQLRQEWNQQMEQMEAMLRTIHRYLLPFLTSVMNPSELSMLDPILVDLIKKSRGTALFLLTGPDMSVLQKFKDDHFSRWNTYFSILFNTDWTKPKVSSQFRWDLVLDAIKICEELIGEAVRLQQTSSIKLLQEFSRSLFNRRDIRSIDYAKTLTDEERFRDIHIFRTTLCNFCSVLSVASDGNCFYRSVLKSIFPNITKRFEDELNVKMRHWINQGDASEDIREFIIPEVNDAETMKKVGVWADHIQLIRFTDAIHRPLWIIRFDDQSLSIDESTNQLVPGLEYRIGEDKYADKEPIYLHFSPYPGHYEAVCLTPAWLLANGVLPAATARPDGSRVHEVTIESLDHRWSKISNAQANQIRAVDLCNFYFDLESIVDRMFAQTTRATSGASVGEADKSVAAKESCAVVGRRLQAFVVGFSQKLEGLGPDYVNRLAGSTNQLCFEVLERILQHDLFLDEGKVLVAGTGPLSSLYTRCSSLCKLG